MGNSPPSIRPADPLTVIATSGPSSVWPKKAYRNPTDQLVKFLDSKHQDDWCIFEFRAEGTGYPDSEVYNRIRHFPWPDHHPPPFAIIPALMASMRNWIQGEAPDGAPGKRRIAVVHCKAGKGRSGTATCSYLISEEGWKKAEALQRFTDRRMRVGFGSGVSIPSQLRWVGYVDRWTNQMNKQYVERPVEIVEIHLWGLRDGVKVTVEGYVEDGRRIQAFHIFKKNEKIVVDDVVDDDNNFPISTPDPSQISSPIANLSKTETTLLTTPTSSTPSSSSIIPNLPTPPKRIPSTGTTVLLKPTTPLILPTSDINIDFERRNKASYTSWTIVTAVAHVWFNAYFEGGHAGHTSGVFEIDWEAMDGIKGSARKGTRALDRLKVVWRYPPATATTTMTGQNIASMQPLEKIISEPARGEPVPEPPPADWRGGDNDDDDDDDKAATVNSSKPSTALLTAGAAIAAGVEALGRDLGLRRGDPASADISRASSVRSATSHASRVVSGADLASDGRRAEEEEEEEEEEKGVRAGGLGGKGGDGVGGGTREGVR